MAILRLQKFLSQCGISSRRKAEELIKQGRITVNGEVVSVLGVKVAPETDEVAVDGKPVKREKHVYIMLNKPPGYLSAVYDSRNKTVLDIVKVSEKVFPVGRLDKESRGLLLLTNDGELAFKLTHPKFEHGKKYVVEVQGNLEEKDINKLIKGVELEDGKARALSARTLKKLKDSTVLEIVLGEGKKRQIRRMCLAIGFEVTDLKRVGFGPLEIGDLKEGSYRYLTQEEIKKL